MSASLRVVLVLSLAGAVPSARAEVLYVAIGGTYAFDGAPRPGDPARLASRLGQAVRVVDLTVPGATAFHVRASQLERAIALRPRLVTLAVGPADVVDGASLASFARDLHVVTELLRKAGATVVISTLPPAARLREAPTPAFQLRVESFNWAIRRIAAYNGLQLVDLAARAPAREVHPSWSAALSAAIGPPRA